MDGHAIRIFARLDVDSPLAHVSGHGLLGHGLRPKYRSPAQLIKCRYRIGSAAVRRDGRLSIANPLAPKMRGK